MKTTRKIIRIDESKCNGCGLCAGACAEGAIAIVNGKAKLVKDQYCDGLGACLGHCPQDAISIEEREAEAFDAEAAEAAKKPAPKPSSGHHQGCPGMALRSFKRQEAAAEGAPKPAEQPSELAQWPVQLKLVPPSAPFWRGADVLLAADCTAFALGAFHAKLLKGKALAIACPKLDDPEGYVEKLTAIIGSNELASLTVARMEVPCCGGLLRMAQAAREAAGVDVPLYDVVVGIEGGILSETRLRKEEKP